MLHLTKTAKLLIQLYLLQGVQERTAIPRKVFILKERISQSIPDKGVTYRDC